MAGIQEQERQLPPQDQVLAMIRTRGLVWSRELIRECSTWDHRKIISRLIRQGYPIRNVSPAGKEACYLWVDGSHQERML